MRHATIAMLLCACAHFTSARHPTAAETEANYREFHKEFVAGHYDKAKAIANQKRVDRQKVVTLVLSAMWREVLNAAVIKNAYDIADKFELDRAAKSAFAQNVFNYLIMNRKCEAAADTAYWFGLGAAYADGAINCAQSWYGASMPTIVARLACGKPGTKELRSRLIKLWIENFKQSSSVRRDYALMTDISTMCPFTADQYLDLFWVGVADKQLYFALTMLTTPANNGEPLKDSQLMYRQLYQTALDNSTAQGGASVLADKLLGSSQDPLSRWQKLQFARLMLDTDEFKKTPADYDVFVAAAVSQFQCGMAANALLKHKLSDAALEKLFLNPKCLGGTLNEIDLELISHQKIGWFFDLSLQAHEYVLARNLIGRFDLDEEIFFNRIVDEAMAARDFTDIVDLAPPESWNQHIYREKILDRILDLDEEWFVVRYAVSQTGLQSDNTENWYAWIERAYLRALRRGAFELAAEIATKGETMQFRRWGIDLAFESACKADLKEAEKIARRFLDREALHRVVLLNYKKKQTEERQRKKRECQEGDDWCVKQPE